MRTVSQEIGIYDVENSSNRENIFPELGNSQITEPNIIIPIYSVSNSPNSNNYTNTGNIPIEVSNPVNTGNTSTGSIPIEVSNPVNTGNTSTGSTSNNTSEPSATTDETKTYVEGGTTPDSNIVIKKPMTKYYIYGIIGLVGAFIVYKTFFNKKPT
jgi:hypothetical protein